MHVFARVFESTGFISLHFRSIYERHCTNTCVTSWFANVLLAVYGYGSIKQLWVCWYAWYSCYVHGVAAFRPPWTCQAQPLRTGWDKASPCGVGLADSRGLQALHTEEAAPEALLSHSSEGSARSSRRLHRRGGSTMRC
jgi:hypothetical protein